MGVYGGKKERERRQSVCLFVEEGPLSGLYRRCTLHIDLLNIALREYYYYSVLYFSSRGLACLKLLIVICEISILNTYYEGWVLFSAIILIHWQFFIFGIEVIPTK